MAFKHSYIDFRISRRTLWVGMQAYPLHNVARVQPLVHIPDRRRAVWVYVKATALWTGLGVAAVATLSCLDAAAPRTAYAAIATLVLLILVAHTGRLVRSLGEPNLYALSVETAGRPQMALVSTNRNLIYELARRVVDAIDNPAAEFAMTVEHIYGDKVLGDKFEGDMIHGNRIQNG